MKTAIIKFVIIEVGLLLALAGEMVYQNLQENPAIESTAPVEQTQAINTAESTPTPTETPSATPAETADNIEATPAEETITITMANELIADGHDYIASQAAELGFDMAIDEENTTCVLSLSQQESLIDNTKSYINSILIKSVENENPELIGVVYDSEYTKLTYVVNGDEYDGELSTGSLEEYFIILHMLNGQAIDKITINVTIQNSASDEIYSQYSYPDTLDERQG